MPLDLRQLVEEVQDILAFSAFHKGLEMLCYVDPEVRGPVVGDPARLKQILVNLVGNAIKFTEKGEIMIDVRVLESDGEAATIQLFVKDTGIGIPESKFNTLFESFSQVDASTTRKYGGSGLGLAISYQLSRMMGGKMWLESAPNEGSTFYFTIRVGLSEPWKLPEGGHPARGLTDKKIFAAFDNYRAVELLKRHLDHWETKSRWFVDVDMLLSAAREAKPDHVLIDSRMFDHDPVRFANLIAESALQCDFPYTLVCELWLALYLKNSLNDKGRILTKPLKRNELLAALLLRKQVAERPVVAADGSLARKFPLRILIAEDNPINLEVANGMLNSLGYTASHAENGLEVLAKLEEESFDLIFMDVQMPKLDGLETTRRIITKFDGRRRPMIVAMTANAMESDRQACLEAGMDTFISKPFAMDELVSMINSLGQFVGEGNGPVTHRDDVGPGNGAAAAVVEEPGAKEEEVAAPETNGKYQHIDLSMLYEASNGQDAFVMAVAGKLIKKLPEAIQELRGHWKEGDYDQIRAVAHRTKSSAAYTGAAEMKERFRALEHMAREMEDVEEIPDVIDDLDDYVTEVVAELKAAVKKIGG